MNLLNRLYLIVLAIFVPLAPIQAENLPGSIYAIERYNTIKR